MRIAILAPVLVPRAAHRYGGIEWIVSLLSDGLAEAGHESTLVRLRRVDHAREAC